MCNAGRGNGAVESGTKGDERNEMIRLPDMTYDEAERLWLGTDYACEATHQDENPIHGPDAAAFFLEGYLCAQKRLVKIRAELRNAKQGVMK